MKKNQHVEQNGNENAYPQGSHSNGLTKRELFAAMALPVAFQFYDEGYCGLSITDRPGSANVTALAVQLADELLAALSTRKPESGEFTLTYRGNGPDLATDVIALLNTRERKRFLEKLEELTAGLVCTSGVPK